MFFRKQNKQEKEYYEDKKEFEKKKKANFYAIIELTNRIKENTYFLDLEKQNQIIQELEDTLNKIENIKKEVNE